MMQQGPVDPDNPAANMQKYMMYIAPFFALTGLYWQFGLVIYWVTTNMWTLGQQHFLFRNLPIVGSATVGASAVQAAPGNTSVSGKSGATGKVGTSGKAAIAGKPDASGKSGGSSKSGAPAKPAAPKAGRERRRCQRVRTAPRRRPVRRAGCCGSARASRSLKRCRLREEAKVVRQQPVRQTRSKRSGKR